MQITQMKFRLSEGAGECFYYVGVEDRGYPAGLEENDLRLSLNNLNYMAQSLRATATIAHLFLGAFGRLCALVQVRRNCVEEMRYVELRVAGARRAPLHDKCCQTMHIAVCRDWRHVPSLWFAKCARKGALRGLCVTRARRAAAVGGSVDSGKSTAVAVLTRGADGAPALDDGAGQARTSVFRHKHEVQTGHTSSISQAMLGYDAAGRVLNYRGVARLTAAEISAAAGKLMHFVDLGGHARYLKTALYGAPRRDCSCCDDRRFAPLTESNVMLSSAAWELSGRPIQKGAACSCNCVQAHAMFCTSAGMTSLLPDFLMLCVCAKAGVNLTTREHFAAALALDMPVFCVITKTDAVSSAALSRTLRDVRVMLATAADAVGAPLGDVAGGSADDWSEGGGQRQACASGKGSAPSAAQLCTCDERPESSSTLPERCGRGGAEDRTDAVVEGGGIFDSDDQRELRERRQEQVRKRLMRVPVCNRSLGCGCVSVTRRAQARAQ
jgi:Elongation factor Tu GTP binding domain